MHENQRNGSTHVSLQGQILERPPIVQGIALGVEHDTGKVPRWTILERGVICPALWQKSPDLISTLDDNQLPSCGLCGSSLPMEQEEAHTQG